ncbi:MAG: hypothetical protein CFE41_03570 [Burkholderiales bacterium PBB2]|nr:MAG: hypothetical protein CFE41_03570 [Burkholderiales bacterium PBB2]
MIESIYLEEEVFREMGIGLPDLVMTPPLEMRGLSNVVLLAGPNGAGKSRLLRLVPGVASKKLLREQMNALEEQESTITEVTLPELQNALELELAQPFPHQNSSVNMIQSTIAQSMSELERIQSARRMSDALTLSRDVAPRFAKFVPTGYQLSDPFQWTQAEADMRAAQLATRITSSQEDAPAYAARVLRNAVEEGYQRLLRHETSPCDAEKKRDSLQNILRSLLGADFEVEMEDGRLKLGAFNPFNQVLSPGQQVLFQFGCLLHAQVEHVQGSIVLMDEPENHLHPGVLINVIDTLKSLLTNGQLWIATHSVPLIAHLMSDDSDCLWFVNEGRVRRAGRTPEIVLESLLGGPKGSSDLQALTMLPGSFAANRFLCECLVAPGVVGPDVKDPQTNQIREALWNIGTQEEAPTGKLRILDFGAGKGRLLATLMDSISPNQEPWFDYIAYDIGEQDRKDCENQIASVYGDAKNRWFKELSTLSARMDVGSFDAVVMCNVLHEVPPEVWASTLNDCAKLLKPRGHLLVVEDYGIPVGERAHNYGFLLLDEPELVALFSIKEIDRKAGKFIRASSFDQRYQDRLVAHLIQRECVTRISSETRKSAIKTLRDRMTDEVQKHLSEPTISSNKGRSYARSTQLLANATIWCRDHDN